MVVLRKEMLDDLSVESLIFIFDRLRGVRKNSMSKLKIFEKIVEKVVESNGSGVEFFTFNIPEKIVEELSGVEPALLRNSLFGLFRSVLDEELSPERIVIANFLYKMIESMYSDAVHTRVEFYRKFCKNLNVGEESIRLIDYIYNINLVTDETLAHIAKALSQLEGFERRLVLFFLKDIRIFSSFFIDEKELRLLEKLNRIIGLEEVHILWWASEKDIYEFVKLYKEKTGEKTIIDDRVFYENVARDPKMDAYWLFSTMVYFNDREDLGDLVFKGLRRSHLVFKYRDRKVIANTESTSRWRRNRIRYPELYFEGLFWDYTVRAPYGIYPLYIDVYRGEKLEKRVYLVELTHSSRYFSKIVVLTPGEDYLYVSKKYSRNIPSFSFYDFHLKINISELKEDITKILSVAEKDLGFEKIDYGEHLLRTPNFI